MRNLHFTREPCKQKRKFAYKFPLLSLSFMYISAQVCSRALLILLNIKTVPLFYYRMYGGFANACIFYDNFTLGKNLNFVTSSEATVRKYSPSETVIFSVFRFSPTTVIFAG